LDSESFDASVGSFAIVDDLARRGGTLFIRFNPMWISFMKIVQKTNHYCCYRGPFQASLNANKNNGEEEYMEEIVEQPRSLPDFGD
jgi:hypothetical protein